MLHNTIAMSCLCAGTPVIVDVSVGDSVGEVEAGAEGVAAPPVGKGTALSPRAERGLTARREPERAVETGNQDAGMGML